MVNIIDTTSSGSAVDGGRYLTENYVLMNFGDGTAEIYDTDGTSAFLSDRTFGDFGIGAIIEYTDSVGDGDAVIIHTNASKTTTYMRRVAAGGGLSYPGWDKTLFSGNPTCMDLTEWSDDIFYVVGHASGSISYGLVEEDGSTISGGSFSGSGGAIVDAYVMHDGADLFLVWSEDTGEVYFRTLDSPAGTFGAIRTITVSTLSEIKSLSAYYDGTGEVYIVYTDSGNIYMRSRDTADTTTTDYTEPTISDGGFEAVSLSCDQTNNDPIISVITTNTKDVSATWYDSSAASWSGWKTFATTTGQEDGLSAARTTRTDGSTEWLQVLWVNNQGSYYDVRFDEISKSNIANTPPDADPYTKANFDAADSAEFTWDFDDVDVGDTQSAYQVLIDNNTTGASAYDSGKVTSGTSSLTLAGGTLTNDYQYTWNVRVWDQDDETNGYSADHFFYCSAKPTASVTNPATDGAIVSSATLTATWSYSDPESENQSAYKLELYSGTDQLLWTSGKTAGTETELEIEYTLSNNTSYEIQLTLWDAQDVPSDVATRTFDTSFTPPTTPTITLSPSDQNGYIEISINNQGDTDVLRNEVWRYTAEDNTPVRISSNVTPDDSYKDYAVASDVDYYYFARAIAAANTYADSATSNDSLNLTGVFLHNADRPSTTSRNYEFDGSGRNEVWDGKPTTRSYAGRVFDVYEFGEHQREKVSFSLQLPSNTGDYEALRELIKGRNILCYRDGRGRKIFGVIEGHNFDDVVWGHTATLTLNRANYDEGV